MSLERIARRARVSTATVSRVLNDTGPVKSSTRRVAGLSAIVSEMDSELIAELSAQRIPVVFYDVGTPRRNITNIRVDYASGWRS